MVRIPAEKHVHVLQASNPTAAEVDSGAEVVFETLDCFSGRIQAEADLYDESYWADVNPATGPLRVRGAKPGDALAVTIRDIEVAERGCLIAAPGAGALGHRVTASQTKIVPIRDSRALFAKNLSLPLQPMVGVIGTAPAPEDGPVPTGTPGRHGGNMDCKLITKGSRVWLPVFVDGANLALGDLHAAMADGEVVLCGVEVAGTVLVSVEVVARAALPAPLEGPVVETPDAYYGVASAETLDAAAALAIDQTFAFLKARLPLSANETAMLMSLACDLQVNQVVDPLKTARMRVPKDVFAAHGLRVVPRPNPA